MSATDELRKILNERGVEWEEATDSMGKVETWWHSSVFDTDAIAALGEEVGSVELDIPKCITPEQAVDATIGPKITEDTSDGWHSFKDLYHHRALLFSVIVHNYSDMCWKSKKHHDGKELDWNFIVGIDTPWGQASYHYGMEYWDLFDCKEVEQAPFYDGYTADESVARIARLVELDTPVYLCPKCGVAYELDFIDKEFGKPNYCPHCGYRRLYV